MRRAEKNRFPSHRIGRPVSFEKRRSEDDRREKELGGGLRFIAGKKKGKKKRRYNWGDGKRVLGSV